MREHRLFAAVLLSAAALRAVTMAGYRPAKLYWVDSFTYIDVALRLRPSGGYQPGGFQPSGYPVLLWLLRPFHSIALVVGVQHLMGLAIGLLVYAVLRRRTALPSWCAVLAAVPGLFDARFLRLEHAVLSDTLFLFLVVAALAVLLWSPAPSPKAAAAAGLLLASAALTRTIAVPLILLAVAHLTFRRSASGRCSRSPPQERFRWPPTPAGSIPPMDASPWPRATASPYGPAA